MPPSPRIAPTSDLAFRKILSSENHKTIPQGLIGDFFGFTPDLDDIHIDNPYTIDVFGTPDPDDAEAAARLRQTARDVTISVRAADVLIELQIRRTAHFDARTLLYHCQRFVSHYSETSHSLEPAGEEHRYATLRPVYGLNILGHTRFPCTHALHLFSPYDHERKEGWEPALLRIGFLELSKTRGLTIGQRRWRDFLLTGYATAGAPSYIGEAAAMLDYVNLDRREKTMIDMQEKAIATWEAELAYAIGEARQKAIKEGLAEGQAKGLAEGEAKARFAMARNARAMGLSLEDIATLTGLSQEELLRL